MTHPILAAASDIRAVLKGVAGANPTFMSTIEKAEALRELVAAEAQLVELRLRVLADAGELADATGAKDAAGWLAHQTRTRFADARADLALATVLDRERPVLASGMRDGAVTLAQAHVIRRALDALPAAVDADTVDRAEAHLVGLCGRVRAQGAGPDRAPGPRRGRPGDRRGRGGRPAGRPRNPCCGADADDDAPPGRRHHPHLRAGAGRGRDPPRDVPRSVRQPPRPARQDRRLGGAGRRAIRSPGCPTRGGMGEAFARFLETADPPAPGPRWGCDHGHRDHPPGLVAGRAREPPTSSAPASSPAMTSPATASPQPRPAGSRAPRRSSPPSSTAPASRSTSDARSGSSPPPSARRC